MTEEKSVCKVAEVAIASGYFMVEGYKSSKQNKTSRGKPSGSMVITDRLASPVTFTRPTEFGTRR